MEKNQNDNILDIQKAAGNRHTFGFQTDVGSTLALYKTLSEIKEEALNYVSEDGPKAIMEAGLDPETFTIGAGHAVFLDISLFHMCEALENSRGGDVAVQMPMLVMQKGSTVYSLMHQLFADDDSTGQKMTVNHTLYVAKTNASGREYIFEDGKWQARAFCSVPYIAANLGDADVEDEELEF